MNATNISVANGIRDVHNIHDIEIKEEVVFELLSDDSETDESCPLVICEDSMDDECSVDTVKDEIESLNALKETLDDDSLTADGSSEVTSDAALDEENTDESSTKKIPRLTKKKVNSLLNDLEEYLRNTDTIPDKDDVHRRIEKIATEQNWRRSIEVARRERKRLQNRRAAALYRMRKKHEFCEAAETERALIEKNQELHRRVDKLQTIVACFRTMFSAVSKTRDAQSSSNIEHPTYHRSQQ